MEGGEISGNTGGYYGVVSLRFGDSSFTMTGGKISGNTSIRGGGGVFVESSTINNKSRFTMTGGKITGNTAPIGGGVYVKQGIFTMTGGEISGNTATERGGGIHLDFRTVFGDGGVAYGELYMEGGTVYGNNEGIYSNLVKNSSGTVLTGNGSALYRADNYCPAEYGTLNPAGDWMRNGTLSTTDNTIRVTNGVLQ